MNTNKVILITGASSGIGKASANKLLADGHIVYVAARRVEKMKELEEKGAIAIKMDITKEEDIDNVVETIMKKSGRIDVLVNNAGYAIYGAMEETSVEEARRQFEVNLFGLASLSIKVLPHMRKQGSGKIINISSMGGKIYTPLGSWYHASKHALEGWSDCLRLELKQFGIDVVIVEPGIINTEFGDVMVQPMLERSAEGPYSHMAKSVAKATNATYEKGGASPPSVIADVISKAIRSSNPKTRYVAGKMARIILIARKWLSDRMFDRILKMQLK